MLTLISPRAVADYPLGQLYALYHHQQTTHPLHIPPCTLSHIPTDQRLRSHLSHILLCIHIRIRLIFLNLPSASIGRRPSFLYMLTNGIQRHPGAQIPACLPHAQLDWHLLATSSEMGTVIRYGVYLGRRSCINCIGYEGGEDLVDEF